MIYKILPLTLVSGKINLAMFLSFVMSVIVNFTLNLDAIFEKYRFVPPYMSSPHRMWSPACNSWTTAVVAARPDAKVRQCLAPSSEAMHFCNTFLVGFPHLLYSNPCRGGGKMNTFNTARMTSKILVSLLQKSKINKHSNTRIDQYIITAPRELYREFGDLANF